MEAEGHRPLDEKLADLQGGGSQWLYIVFLCLLFLAASAGLIVAGATGDGKRDACYGFAVLTVPAAGLAAALAWRTRTLAPWNRAKANEKR